MDPHINEVARSEERSDAFFRDQGQPAEPDVTMCLVRMVRAQD